MDYDYEVDYDYVAELPSQHAFISAVDTAGIPPTCVPADYLWLERYMPYSGETEASIHWFVRFDRLR